MVMVTRHNHTAQQVANMPLGSGNGFLDSVRTIDELPIVDVLVSSLVPGFFLRQAGTDAAHVQLLADAAGSAQLPPIIVQQHTSRIIDGLHRCEVAKQCRQEYIRAHVIDCSDEEALILAVRSNTLHGMPLSKVDRIAGAKRILSANPDWSDRALAEITGLSTRTIGVLRNRSADDIPVIGKRLGRDGKRRPLSAAEGRKRAADYIIAHPGAPLREVAKNADVSLGTVHDVRERLRRGADPVTDRQESRLTQAGGQSATSNHTDRSSPLDSESTQVSRGGFSPGLSDRNGNSERLAWPSISAKLASDPALRYSEGGRAFIRWMAAHAARVEEWREFIDAIPVHWLDDVSLLAGNVSAEWMQFEEWLKTKQRSAG
jgi:ParB-like chromosome segregation protein Spo0J